jgi:hypothetical protein
MITIFLPQQAVNKLPDTAFQRYNKQTAMWILWQIQRRDLFIDWDAVDANRWAELSKKYLRSIHQQYKPYIDLFEQLNIIEINHKYWHFETHGQTKRYRIVRGNLRYYQLTKKSIINSYNRLLIKSKKNYTFEQKQRLEYLKSININLPAVRSWLKSNPTTKAGRALSNYEKQLILFKCILINNKEAYLIEDRYGREHTPMTNLPSIIRDNFTCFIKNSYINYNNYNMCSYNPGKKGEKVLSLCGLLFEFDIPTSQPRCLIKWLNNKDINQDEYKEYIKAIVNKDFYTEFCNRYNKKYGTNKTRNDMKIPLLSTMFGRPQWENRYIEVYKDWFPTIWQAIIKHKQEHGYKAVAQEIQRIEADYVFGFCKSLTEPYFTVHDAIYTCADITEAFNEMVDMMSNKKIY